MGRLSRGKSDALGPSPLDQRLGSGGRYDRYSSFKRALDEAQEAKRSLGRAGAYGTPGRPPKMPFRPGRLPRPGPDSVATAISFAAQMFDQLEFDLAWAKAADQAAGYSAGLAADGFTLLCSTDPANFPAEQIFRIGQLPDPLPITSVTCAVSAVQQANGAWGTTIRAGATFAQMAQGGSPYNPVGPRGGRPFERWSKPSPGATHDIPLAPAVEGHTMPLPTGDPPPAQIRERIYAPSPSARSRSGTLPGYEWEFGPGGPTAGEKPHEEAPPPPGTKEEKLKLNPALGVVGRTFGSITEILDFARCLYKASGGKGAASMTRMSDHISKNFKLSDPAMVADAIKCLALNHLEDLVIGKVGQAVDKSVIGAEVALGGKPARGVTIKRPPSPFEKSEKMPTKPKEAKKPYNPYGQTRRRKDGTS